MSGEAEQGTVCRDGELQSQHPAHRQRNTQGGVSPGKHKHTTRATDTQEWARLCRGESKQPRCRHTVEMQEGCGHSRYQRWAHLSYNVTATAVASGFKITPYTCEQIVTPAKQYLLLRACMPSMHITYYHRIPDRGNM